MLQSLNLTPEDHCLEVGTGSGYITACLGQLTEHVTSYEIQESFIEGAAKRLRKAHVSNVELMAGDIFTDCPKNEYFDVIAVTGAVANSPAYFEKKLKVGGRLFIVVGRPPVMEAKLIIRESESGFRCASLFETELKCLQGAEQRPLFTF